jgi:hypothetical protein
MTFSKAAVAVVGSEAGGVTPLALVQHQPDCVLELVASCHNIAACVTCNFLNLVLG